MTDLQITLFGAGGVFIVGVFSYNKWQEYKAKKSVERAFSTDHDDVLMREGDAPVTDAQEPVLRQEPRFDAAPAAKAEPSFGAPPAAPVSDAPVHAEPSLGDIPAETVAAPAAEPVQEVSAASEQATSLVDPLIDCLLPLSLEAPVRGDKILPVLQTLRLVGNKPVHFIGLHVNGDWEPITHGGVYTKMQGGVQLASRSTALNELEYSELVTRLRGVADEIGAEPEVPDMMEVMAEARNLHRFVAGHDAQLGVNLHTNGAPWAISTLLFALEKQGFDVRPDGRFVMPDGDGSYLFSLSTNVTLAEETTSRLTLLLDVPCVAPARDGFGAMVACAKALVGRLDATIVDDYNQALSDAALAEIAGQVQEFYQEMDAADISAGSTRALRLFS
ncbi:MAG: cell division protein [Burkholderiales bacterium]|uniref:Cell division protein ZipA n=1 Tax=Janthinobacterium tructae TaxID=2590869 RepID=A0A4Y6RA03_9BURK|nr:cell division protein ZipA C-terminal FtsZ-binding domain-containing protein [Janthinobacterium tructae]MBH1981278.1 cell division protein [Burkholderiales bacterium]MBH1993489.1 cell division protein [Burkholderiales bacterium]MBH2068249.1 cell division protein [Burkholderiales bacterium]QDG69340.1 cell division protein [Janthinobacterium tructae]